MKRPLVYVLIYLIFGILFGQHFYEYKYVALFAGILILSVTVIIFIKRVKSSVLFISVAVFGFVIGNMSLCPSDKALYAFSQEKEKADIKCEILDLSKKYDFSNKYIVKIQDISNNNINIKSSSKSILFSKRYFKPGDVIEFYGQIAPISERKNKTDFDAFSYYKSYNIEYKIYAENIKNIGHNNNFNSAVKALRNSFADNYDSILPKREASFMKSIILGDRAELDEDLYNTFRDGGVAHIVAISGLHIAILAGALRRLIEKRNKNISYAATALFLLFYSILTGLSPSVVRASLMTSVLMLGSYVGRDYDIISSAAAVCIVMLVHNCFNIYNIGFCYSFASVFGIGMVSDIIQKYKIKNLRLAFVIEFVLVSITANLFSKPITVYNFYYINTWDIISNILIVPLMSVLVGLGTIAGLIGYICSAISRFLIGCPYVLINFYEFVCKSVMKLPYYKIETGGISLAFLGAVYVSYIVIYNIFISIKNIKYIALPLIMFAGAFLTGDESNIEYIDAGKVKAEIIIRDNSCTIVNCGGIPQANYGKYRILNYLKYRNIKNIESIYVIRTNYYYMGGIFEIWDNINIDRIYVLNSCDKNSMYYKLIDTAKHKNTEIVFVDEIYDVDGYEEK